MSKINRFSQEEDDFLKINYPLKGLKYCASSLGRAQGTIQARVQQYLKLPPLSKEIRSLLTSKPRPQPFSTLAVNPEQFMDIQTPEVAYILGLLWADGFVNNDKVGISCVKTDALEYMNTFLQTGKWRYFDATHKRYEIECKESRTIYTGNRQLVSILKDYDYISKSNASADKILSKIPEYLRHYWFRGLIDGDGYIGRTETSCFIKITSSYEQDWDYMKRICEKLDIVYSMNKDRWFNPKSKKMNSRSVFAINNREGLKRFCDYIYKDRDNDHIGLSRKFLKKTEIYKYFIEKERAGKSSKSIFNLKS